MAVELPTQFGRYQLLKKLGEGGMGVVYLARDTQLDRQVPLKTPSFSRHEDSVVLGRFYREARAAATLQHPNICPLFDVGEIDGVPYLTMAYVEGRPLSAVIRTGQRLDERQVAQLVRKLALALDEAHRRGVIHRDLKPSNIMIDQRREPVIMDFGLARRTDRQETRLTQSGAILGTPAYMAPEQVLGELAAIGPRTDVYSLGVILYELLVGRPPFEGGMTSVLAKIITQEPESPETIRADLSAELAGICSKAMAKQPKERWASMAELAGALTGYLKRGGGTMAPVVSEGESVGAAAVLVPVPPAKAGPQPVSGGVALPIIELIDDEAPEAVVQLLPGMAPEGRPGLRNWADVWARRLGIGASRQWWRKHRVSFAAGCVGLALLAVVIWFLVRPQKDRQIAAEGSSVAAGPSGGPDSSSASEIPSGSARAAAAGPAPPLAIAPFDAAKAKEHQQAWADYLGVPVETTNSIGMKFVLIPPGEFEMGSSLEDVDRLVSRARQQNLPQWYADCISSEAPRHRVRLTRAFYLGLCEVTQAQYQRVAGSNPSGFQESGPDAPVESVSWEEAAGFCRLLSDMPGEKGSAGRYGLPTEAQWEYAARAGTTTAWSFGDDVAALSDHAWWSLNSERKTHSVGLKKPNAFGLLDVHGNVFEWCADWHSEEYYENSALADPTGPASGESRVLRGGSWSGDDPNLFRCAYRLNYPADYRSPGYGFRVARALTP